MNIVKEALRRLQANMPAGGGPAPKLLLGLFGVSVIGQQLYKGIVTIEPGHVGLVYNRVSGLDDTPTGKLQEGFHFIIPWFQRAIVYDIRTRPQLVNTSSGSKDLQMIQISLRVLFRPDASSLPDIYRRLGKDYDERVLPSIVNEVCKAVVAQYNAAELLTKRDAVSAKIRALLVGRAADFKILLDDVAITHLAFSKEYTSAVEAKQVAQQDAERAKYIVERAIQEKRTIIIKAEGEAKSAELIGQAILNNPAFLQLRRIENAKEIANVISTSANKIYLNAETLLVNQLGEATALNANDSAAEIAGVAVPIVSASSATAPVVVSSKKGWLG